MRIDFAFSDAAFDLAFLPFKIPYPVPFKLLGDETKGFIDVTYLAPDGGLRLSRGNKVRFTHVSSKCSCRFVQHCEGSARA